MTPTAAGFYVDPFALSMVRLRSVPGHPDRFTVVGCHDGGPMGARMWTGTLYCSESNTERQKVELETSASSQPSRLKGSWLKPQMMISFENGRRWKRLLCVPPQLK